MEGPSNGGMLYHEVQESKLCAVHCVNTVLQGPFFSELDLAALASDLDQRERQVMLGTAGGVGTISGDFLSEDSHNVSMGGDFSIQVLQKALEVWDLQIVPLNSPVAEPSKSDPAEENAYICHLLDHWFCIRKVNGEWYNFNSLYAAPEHLTSFYLSAYLDTLKGAGWSIFLVRGNFPRECPLSSSEASYGFGQWLLPEDAKSLTKSCNQSQVASERADPIQSSYTNPFVGNSEQEMEDLNAAIEASLMESAAFGTETKQMQDSSNSVESIAVGTEASLMEQAAFSTETKRTQEGNHSKESMAVFTEASLTQSSMDSAEAGSETSMPRGDIHLSGSSDPAAAAGSEAPSKEKSL